MAGDAIMLSVGVDRICWVGVVAHMQACISHLVQGVFLVESNEVIDGLDGVRGFCTECVGFGHSVL